MFRISIPKNIALALKMLNEKGEAYIVGGCVRDALLNLKPTDYDITTSLTPDKIKEVFKDYRIINNNGEKHGTVNVIINKEKIEITTYRYEGEYLDGRHPSFVGFTDDLALDLKRRDFTINAMAYNDSKGLIDYYGGKEDLKNGIIRTVGTPSLRFGEDYLRILRGLRFMGRFNFKIEKETKDAMLNLAYGLKKISSERIVNELKEILVSKNILEILLEYRPIFTTIFPELIDTINFDQKSKWHSHDVYTHICYVTSYTKPDFITRLAALLHDIGKPHSYQEEVIDKNVIRHFKGHAKVSYQASIEILKRLKVSNEIKNQVLFLVLYHDIEIMPNKKSIKNILLKMPNLNLELFYKLIDLKKADSLDHTIKTNLDYELILNIAKEIILSGEIITLKELAIDGNDLKILGYHGSDIGKILNYLLKEVIEGRLKNQKEILLKSLVKVRL